MTNQIIAELSAECRAALLPRMMTKPIRAGEILYVAGSPAQNLIFPEDGMISLQSRLIDGRMIEQMQVCRDGVAGIEAFFGTAPVRSHAVVVLSGVASWLPAQELERARQDHPTVDRALMQHFGQQLARTAQAVVCASVHTARQRIAAWLLRADDMIGATTFDIMQRSLAEVLGLRLATISEGCSWLMHQGAIRYARGSLMILDRALLETSACECYQANRAITA